MDCRDIDGLQNVTGELQGPSVWGVELIKVSMFVDATIKDLF